MKTEICRIRRARPLLGTFVTIELKGDVEEDYLDLCATEGFEAIAEIDHLMSYHRHDSELTRLNRLSPGIWTEVSTSMIEILSVSNHLYLESKGIFDIRCGATLVQQGLLPKMNDADLMSKRMPDVLPVEIKELQVRKTGSWTLDLGGIAKGYAVDCAVDWIKWLTAGTDISGSVNAGGDLCVFGDEDSEILIRIQGNKGLSHHSLNVRNLAVATSLVRSSVSDLQSLSPAAHVGMPSGNILKDLKTVSVFAEKCLMADALTKIVLLGSNKIAIRCLDIHRAWALVFGRNGEVERTMGFKDAD